VSSHLAAQWLVVAAVVLASTVYAAWALMPAALRRALAAAALRLPLPAPIAARMRVQATRVSSCGCAGCDGKGTAPGVAPSPEAAARPIEFHRRLPR
jgi:uncharacterized protein DUF6587